MRIIPLVDISNPAYTNRVPVTKANVGADHQWNFTQRKMSFEKDLGLKGSYCFHPFNSITIDKFGDVYMCICQADLPIPVGKIWDFDSLDAIVQHPIARELQASILDGSYRYCNQHNCGILKAGELNDEITHRPDTINWINFAIDSSCNLTCPSCRRDFIFVNEGLDYDLRISMVDHIVKLVEQHDHWLKFSISNDGDPFASLVYRDLLSKLNIKGMPVEVEIVTNGILAKAYWHKMTGVHQNVVRFKVSMDAACEQTYAITRRGGSWTKLLESIRYIAEWKRTTGSTMELMANFVVQQANYKEMAQYVELCEQLGFTEIYFQRIVDWGTFGNQFHKEAVWQESHPEHQEFLQQLRNPLLKNNSKINLTNLSNLG